MKRSACSEQAGELSARPAKQPKATDNEQTTHVQASRLLSLPLEVRVQILEHVFPCKEVKTITAKSDDLGELVGGVNHGAVVHKRDLQRLKESKVFLVCRQLYNEAMTVIFDRNTFVRANCGTTIQQRFHRQKEYLKLNTMFANIQRLQIDRVRLWKQVGWFGEGNVELFDDMRLHEMVSLRHVKIRSSDSEYRPGHLDNLEKGIYGVVVPNATLEEKVRHAVKVVQTCGRCSITYAWSPPAKESVSDLRRTWTLSVVRVTRWEDDQTKFSKTRATMTFAVNETEGRIVVTSGGQEVYPQADAIVEELEDKVVDE